MSRIRADGVDCDNAPTGRGRRTLSLSREAVPNLNQCSRVGTACDKGVGRSKPPPGTARAHKSGHSPTLWRMGQFVNCRG